LTRAWWSRRGCCPAGTTRWPSPTENRKLFLDSSVFNLVDNHIYLSLTDPKLLGWYLHLCPEDRKIIQDDGGFHHFLQRHPALELSRHHVYVKNTTGANRPAQPIMTSSNHTHDAQSTMSGAKTSRSEMPHAHRDIEVLPNLRETLTLLGCSNSGDASQKHPHEGVCHTKQQIRLQDRFLTAFDSQIPQEANHQTAQTVMGSSHLSEQRPLWQMASNSNSAAVFKDPATLASFSLDVELERCRLGGKPELRSQTAMAQSQCADFTYAEVSQIQPTSEKDSSLEYYSFDSVAVDGTEFSDRSIMQPDELQQVGSPLDQVEENSTVELCQDHMVCGNENTADNDGFRCVEDQSDSFHSIMSDDKSIVICLTSKTVKAHTTGVHSAPVISDSEAQAASSETLKSDSSAVKINTAETSASPLPRASTCVVMVGTERAPRTSAGTQTEDPETADKHVITEVHMADLDYLAEEFIKLSMAQEEHREQKEKRKSLGCSLTKDCDCIQRAQQAELHLLALQYAVCRQHCWRLFCTSAEGGQLPPTPKNPPVNISSVLQKLDSDYSQMRDKIVAGVPLEQLESLSVDSEKITTGARYSPAQIIADVLGDVPTWSSEEQKKPETSEQKCSDNKSRSSCRSQQLWCLTRLKQVKKENSKPRRAVTLVPWDKDVLHKADKPEEKQTTAECNELSTCEAWYDAEEDLEPAGAAAAAETGQESDPTVIAKDVTNKSASEDVKSSVLCVSNLPASVTDSDVMLWFEKYRPSEVSISALKNDLRVAIVILSGVQSAEAAARELNGCCVQGHALHVEHINRAPGGSQNQSQNQNQSQASASIRGPGSSREAAKPQNSRTDSSCTDRKLITQPPLSSGIKNRKVVCISPTAKGTCVPQHYGTMGSFDTLMAELTQRHPDVARQRIVDALMELKDKHQGVLSGLPLRTIREMTSELLSRQPAPRS
ncbi:RNA-binding protein 44, partial [Plectropomus leopardus]|uniref:RNA-binding protein 44 n=1 Tax=Plectropomus leopardus TaxID=160734 RepID=UPI001C4C1203